MSVVVIGGFVLSQVLSKDDGGKEAKVDSGKSSKGSGKGSGKGSKGSSKGSGDSKGGSAEAKKPKAVTGKFILDSTPPTVVFEKGKKKGKTPFSITRKPGGYTFVLVAEEKRIRREVKVKVVADEIKDKHVLFEEGTLKLKVVPRSRHYLVEIDNQPAKDALVKPTALYDGKHNILVRNIKTGKFDEKTVEIKPGQETLVEFDLK